MDIKDLGSRKTASAAIKIAISDDREEENQLKEFYMDLGIKTAGVDFGGEFISSITKVIERAIVAARRENLISDTHVEEGAVAGATREAISQIMTKALGLNVGGKIGIARQEDHISVAVFFGIGLLHLNEIAIGLGHRVI